MDRLKERVGWAWQELDAVLALVLGVAFASLGLLDVVQGEALTAATLGVLAVLALAVLRERTSRESFVDGAREVQKSLERIEESVSGLLTGTQYRVLRYDVHWELVTPDGNLAVGTKCKRIRFLQNGVISLTDFVQADGRVSNQHYSPGTKVDSFRVGARMYDLISLRRVMQAGAEIDFHVEREIQSAFPAAHENVTIDVLDPTDVVVLQVTWPQDRPPRNVRLEHIIEQRVSGHDIDSCKFEHRADGRTDLSQTVESPPLGSTITLSWDW